LERASSKVAGDGWGGKVLYAATQLGVGGLPYAARKIPTLLENSYLPWALERGSIGSSVRISGAAESTTARLALPGARQVDYSWGALNTYREGGQMTAIEHINYRHAFESGFSNVSRFAEGTTARDIQSFVDQASRYGNVTAQGANGFKLEYNLGQSIGTSQAGAEASGIRIFIRDGQVQTAFPITLP
jgi:hypothetical protein